MKAIKMKTIKSTTMERVKLSTANCHVAAEVRDVKHPEWGDWKFNYKAQALPDGRFAHTVGVGCHSKVVSVGELGDYEVVRWNSKTIISNKNKAL